MNTSRPTTRSTIDWGGALTSTPMTLTFIALVGCLVALASCGKAKIVDIPSVFEITGRTEINGQMIVTARDTGTGCEVIITPNGIMPRNERSADGLSVKQRCVLTGTEQASALSVTTTTIPAGPEQTSAMNTQAADVAAAVRAATAPPPTAREIPPPTGKGSRPRVVAAPARPAAREPASAAEPATDGVEAQMKN